MISADAVKKYIGTRLEFPRRIVWWMMQPAVNNITFYRGDFVVLNHDSAARVGVVVQTRPGKADVLWYECARSDGAKVKGEASDPGRLRLVTSADEIPDAMFRLQTNL